MPQPHIFSYNQVKPTSYKEYLCSGVNMNTTARKLSIFVFVAVATTALTLNTSTTFAVSNTQTRHHIQLMRSFTSRRYLVVWKKKMQNALQQFTVDESAMILHWSWNQQEGVVLCHILRI